MTLEEMSTTELVSTYNALHPPKLLSQWKGRKSTLRERIRALQLEQHPASGPTRTVKAAACELLCHIEFLEDRNRKRELLNRVFCGTPGAQSVGVPYGEILRLLKVEFPTCRTTIAGLRWYAVKIRAEEFGYEGLRLPQRRPRAGSL